MLFTAGLLASQGFFDVVILVPLLTIAAILGDNVGYWFGAKVGYKLFIRPDSRFFKHEYIEQAKRFYDERGGRTVFLARFVPILRTFVPIVAGVVKMNYRNFIWYNLLGALVWGTGVTLLGFYLGNFPFVQHYFSGIILIIIIVTTAPICIELWKQWRKN